MRGIVKVFPGVRALDGVDLQVRAGEVHCLLGQNGAGKSTLIKVLAGAHTVDAGEVLWQGEPASLASPVAALKQGIATIYQELDLVDWLSVGENIFLGHELARAGFSQRATTRRRARELLVRLGHPEISPTREVGTLSAAGKQIVSVARALSRDARLIVMDEPSAVLDGEEVENLFHIVSDLAAAGVAVVYISHRLEEIRRIGDRITVLKDGKTVATGLDARTTKTSELIRLMTGRSIEYVFPPRSVTPPGPEVPPLLSVDGLVPAVGVRWRSASRCGPARSSVWPDSSAPAAARSSRRSSVPAGRTAEPLRSMGFRCAAGRCARPSGPASGCARRSGSRRASILDEAVYRNIAMATIGRFASAGFTRDGAERSAAMKVAATVDVRPADPDRVVRTLSGGNQQKVVLARWLLRQCRVLLLDEPTRGVDVGARSEIYLLIRDLADSGVAVVVVSSEVEEVLGLVRPGAGGGRRPGAARRPGRRHRREPGP